MKKEIFPLSQADPEGGCTYAQLNPGGLIRIENRCAEATKVIALMNSAGQMIHCVEKTVPDNHTIELRLPDLPFGIYYLLLRLPDKFLVTRIPVLQSE